jgi:REP element-mobilizing transposase RayT
LAALLLPPYNANRCIFPHLSRYTEALHTPHPFPLWFKLRAPEALLAAASGVPDSRGPGFSFLYGWWFPNDLRGSSSHEIRVEKIASLDELHHGRKAGQPPSKEIRKFYEHARDILKHTLLTFDAADVSLLVPSFARTIAEHRYTCYGCAIMPDHVHLLIRKHRDLSEVMIEHLQQASREALIEASRRSATHPVWGGPGWKVYLNTRADMERIVKYIHDNPIKAGQPPQEWPFVKVYDGWLPGVGSRK